MGRSKLLSSRFYLVWITRIRRAFAANLDLTDTHKVQIYLQLCESVSLRDISYWLEVILAAGIATLGLVLNSPAVIIGAMLISPLMGTILACGLALATGDIVLWLRATVNLLLSCGVAITFAMVLVWIVPFNEITPEIMARTQPTLLDLIVALFSGAVGSVGTCKQVKGIAASLPGVAIAVALMPPLCVVGYGIGTYITGKSTQGLAVAQGGGLLFVTNLVAIIFTAMVVFFFVQLDTQGVREQVELWKQNHPESRWVLTRLRIFPRYTTFRRIGGLPSRFFLILLSLAMLAFPLTQSLRQLRSQVTQQQETNRLRQTVKQVWQETVTPQTGNAPVSYVDQLTLTPKNDQLTIQLQVVTDTLYTPAQKDEFLTQLARTLNRPVDSLSLRLIQIPTSQAMAPNPSASDGDESLSFVELQQTLMETVSQALDQVSFPQAFPLVTYGVQLRPDNPQGVEVKVVYLGDRDLQGDAKALITVQIQQALEREAATVVYERVPRNPGTLTPPLTPNQLQTARLPWSSQDQALITKVGTWLTRYPALRVQITVHQAPGMTAIAQANAMTQANGLRDEWINQGLDPQRVQLQQTPDPSPGLVLTLEVMEQNQH